MSALRRASRRVSGLYDATILAALCIFIFAAMVPVLWAFMTAFKSDIEIFSSSFLLPKEWRLDNFVTAWTEGNFGTYFKNSAFVALVVTVLGVAVACPAGYAFAKMRLRRHPAFFYAYLFFLTLPAQSIIVPLFYQMQSYGLLNSLWGLSFALVGLSTPFGVYLMRNFFRDLPESLIEAARIDGARDWSIFWRVMLPLSTPGILALAVFSFLTAWNEYLLALLLLNSDDKRTVPVGLVRFQDLYSSDYGALFAGIVLAIIPSVIVYILLQRSFTRGLTAGSAKE